MNANETKRDADRDETTFPEVFLGENQMPMEMTIGTAENAFLTARRILEQGGAIADFEDAIDYAAAQIELLRDRFLYRIVVERPDVRSRESLPALMERYKVRSGS